MPRTVLSPSPELWFEERLDVHVKYNKWLTLVEIESKRREREDRNVELVVGVRTEKIVRKFLFFDVIFTIESTHEENSKCEHSPLNFNYFSRVRNYYFNFSIHEMFLILFRKTTVEI